MTDININKHYNAFKWAVSKDWRDKNRLHNKIQNKMRLLTDEYNLQERDIVDDLFSAYWERGHYRKYDADKGSLNNWIAGYVDLYLNHVIRRYAVRDKNDTEQRIDPLDQRNRDNVVLEDDFKDDDDYKPELFIDATNPEDLLIAKEMVDFAYGHFSQTEIDYLLDEITLVEAAALSCMSCDAFRKRLERRKRDFRDAMKMLD